MKREARALAHPNIALIKYWGKRDTALNLPAVPSLSVTLAPYRTLTTVVWDAGGPEDDIWLNGTRLVGGPADRVSRFLDRIVEGDRPRVRVESENSFPTAAGLASSSSAFAALALAATAAAGIDATPTERSRLARQGSGSACRSIWGGWVRWDRGERDDGSDSHGVPVAGRDHWDVVVVVALVGETAKAVGSTQGMVRTTATSPLFPGFVASAQEDVDVAQAAVLARDLDTLGARMEHSTYKMHATMMSAQPSIRYMRPKTVAVLEAVEQLRGDGVAAWSTMDAGPNVKVLCRAEDAARVQARLGQEGVNTAILHVGDGARLVD